MNQENPSKLFTHIIKSDLTELDSLLAGCKDFLSANQIFDLAPVRTVLRELAINAIEHGNHADPGKSVTCTIEILGQLRFRITIQDEGDGFDYESLTFELNDPDQERQRGFVIVNSFADEIEFENEGRSVTVYMTLSSQTRYPSSTAPDGYRVISPTGSITAVTAGELKKTLLDLYEKGDRDYRFDMENVEDIDSVGISVMIALSNTLKADQGKARLEMINVNAECKELFRIIRLDTVFKIS